MHAEQSTAVASAVLLFLMGFSIASGGNLIDRLRGCLNINFNSLWLFPKFGKLKFARLAVKGVPAAQAEIPFKGGILRF
ncbi:hypothetical protein [Pannonibacter sp. SL95]|uniref:hypothetical protein n=1 Tax=Pannonibacter sp. SL95 TaxID=2995153 RepID=UPI002272A101|nr:hypothetical protein [Pannonibacter sp. SL95]MCY1705202.1 hypothetical protein [Pannonibacter sp. SL95]